MLRIKSLKVKNFRGFHAEERIKVINPETLQEEIKEVDKEFEIVFPDSNLTVFIGENGSGKSSILDAIGILLNNMVGFVTADETRFDLIQKEDGESELVFNKNKFYKHGYFQKENPLNISRYDIHKDSELEKQPNQTEIKINCLYKDISENLSELEWRIGVIEKEKNVFEIEPNLNMLFYLKKKFIGSLEAINKKDRSIEVLVYYNVARLIAEKAEQYDLDFHYPHFKSYQSAFNNKNKFSNFLSWFNPLEALENSFISRKDFNYRRPELEVVRVALNTFFSSENLEFSYQNITMEIDELSLESILNVTKNNTDFSIHQLSDGEKTLILLVSDLARRCSIAASGFLYDEEIQSNNPDFAPNVLQNATGIVIIDEIDLHLHPKWQRLVLPALMNTFPNIQFIVTTHSPQVLGSVEDDNILVLDQSGIYAPSSSTLGRDSNSNLAIMGDSGRDQKIQEMLDSFWNFLSKNTPESTKNALELRAELEEKYKLKDDPIFKKADAILKRREIIGR